MSKALDISTRFQTCRLGYRPIVGAAVTDRTLKVALIFFAWRLFSSSEIPGQLSNVRAVYSRPALGLLVPADRH
jgi:hypothetical protein